MNIAFCDDEPDMLGFIEASVKKAISPYVTDVEAFSFASPEELLDFISENDVAAVFLDIDMPHISGMEIAASISRRMPETAIIFVTCHDALVYDTFRYRPLAFIRKSHFEREIGDVAKRLAEHFSFVRADITICRGSQIVKIKLCDIIYIEAEGNYLNIKTVDGTERHRDTLASMETLLSSEDFVRVHKGFIVNLNCIKRMEGNILHMKDGCRIPIGRTYERAVRAKLMDSLRK